MDDGVKHVRAVELATDIVKTLIEHDKINYITGGYDLCNNKVDKDATKIIADAIVEIATAIYEFTK